MPTHSALPGLFGELPWVSMADALGWGFDGEPSATVMADTQAFCGASYRNRLQAYVLNPGRTETQLSEPGGRDWLNGESQFRPDAIRLTVRDLVGFGRYPHSKGRLTDADRVHVEQALDWLDLTGMGDRFLDELSGGQRQRAFVAMVLAQDAEYILLDEPLNNLDMQHSVQMMAQLRSAADALVNAILRCRRALKSKRSAMERAAAAAVAGSRSVTSRAAYLTRSA